MASMFPERTKKEKYEGLQVHTEEGEELILAALDSLAPRPGPSLVRLCNPETVLFTLAPESFQRRLRLLL